MSVRVWNDGSRSAVPPNSQEEATQPEIGEEGRGGGGGAGTVMGECMGVMNAHTEFVHGLDWCLFGAEGWCASVGWDEMVRVWDVRGCLRGGKGGLF